MKRNVWIITLIGLAIVLASRPARAQVTQSPDGNTLPSVACDVAGAWVGNSPAIPGAYEIPLVVTELVSPTDPSGHRFAAVIQVANGDATFVGLFPDADRIGGAVGTYVRSGPRTYQVALVDYFVKSPPAGSFERGQILYFENFSGSVECVDPNTKVFSGVVALFSNVDRPDLVVPPLGVFGVHDQDKDDDGFGDEGEVPFVSFPFAVTYKRLP